MHQQVGNRHFFSEFKFYLRSARKWNNNSAMKYIKNFGKVVRIYLASGWIPTYRFLYFKIKLKKVERIFN
ncbi:phage integrase SAM-like domain-containing protein [Mucilaginibacter sp.]